MKHNHYSLLKSKILATMIIVPAVPFIMVLSIGHYYFTSSLESTTISRITRVAEDHRAMIQMFLAERKTDLAFVLDSHEFESLNNPIKLTTILDLLKEKSPAFVDLGVFDQYGNHLAYEGPYRLTGRNYAEAPWFKKALDAQYYISDIFLGYRRVPHFVIAVTKRSPERTWVLRATIDTHLFNEMVRKVRIGRTGEAYILNKSGVFQTHRRSGGDLMEEDRDDLALLTPHQGVKTLTAHDQRGDSYLYATTWLNDAKWLLVVRQEKEDAFRALNTATILVVVTSLLGGAIIISLAFYMTNRVVRQIETSEDEKDKLNQQLIVAGRLAEIGEMSAGFAHEINNPLQIIRAEQKLIETILMELADKGEITQSDDMKEVLDSIDQIKVQVDRCGEITQSILQFARQSNPKPSELSLGVFVPQVVEMLRKKASVNGIEILTEITSRKDRAYADMGQLQQVLLNLLNNAFDAVNDRHGTQGGGQVRVRVTADERFVDVVVSDNGSGISQENLERIFTPFFTTKPVGKGTGLGLPVCYGIVEKMGGVIQVESREGQGSTFTVRLPAVASENQEE